jgi:acyl carrier protein
VDNTAFSAILRRHLKYLNGDAELAGEAPLRDLGLDSMQAVELLFDLEDELGVVLPDSAMTAETFTTANSLWAAVEQAADPSARVA